VANGAADEEQPESSSNERAALAEREDGTILDGKLPQNYPSGAPAHAIAGAVSRVLRSHWYLE
jgi:hypothetical protein